MADEFRVTAQGQISIFSSLPEAVRFAVQQHYTPDEVTIHNIGVDKTVPQREYSIVGVVTCHPMMKPTHRHWRLDVLDKALEKELGDDID